VNFTDVLAKHARNQPDHPAIIDGGRMIAYRELDGRVSNATANLRAAGIRSGDIVAVILPDSAEYLIVTLALARAGAVMAAIDEALSAPEKALAVSTAGIKAIVLDNPRQRIRDLPVLPVGTLCRAARFEHDRQPTDADQPLMIVQSSGTTGTPKSFFWSHRSMAAQAVRHQQCFGWSARDRYLAVVNMKFFWERELCCVLLHLGATIVVNRAASAAELISEVREERITILALTPSDLPPLLNHEAPEFPLFPSVKTMVVGSAPMTHERRLLVRQRLTPNFNEQLGTNEAGLLVLGKPADQDARPDAIGRIVAGVDAQIVDPSGRRVPAGTVGLVGFRGEGFPTGYIDNPEATAKGFRDGWFYPGDLAAIDEQGYFHFKGRADDVINNQGVKFYPVEVEKALLAHPAIAEAAVIGWPDPVCGQTAIAFIVTSREVSADELGEFCGQRIAFYKKPSKYAFVNRLPRNASGKVMKGHLAKLYRDLLASEVAGGDNLLKNQGSVAKS
jgi:acyl-coenzyme A synthetase/AMP-(fatty) acid ligase